MLEERASYGFELSTEAPDLAVAGPRRDDGRAAAGAFLLRPVLLAAGAGVAGLILASPDGIRRRGPAPGSRWLREPRVEVKAAAVEKPEEPTLQGAAPVFKAPTDAGASEVDPAKPIAKSEPPAETEDEPAAAASAAAASASSAATDPRRSPVVDGPAGGSRGARGRP